MSQTDSKLPSTPLTIDSNSRDSKEEQNVLVAKGAALTASQTFHSTKIVKENGRSGRAKNIDCVQFYSSLK